MKIIIYSITILLSIASNIWATPPLIYQNVVVPQRIVQFDANYFQGLNSYYAVGDKIRAEKATETTSEVEFYKGQIDMLLKILATKQGIPVPGTPIAPVPTPEVPVAGTVPEQPPVPANTGDYQVTEVDKKVYNIFKSKCSRCHGDTKQDGGLALVKDNTLQLVDIYDRVEIYDRTLGLSLEARGKARMPKGGVALSDDEVETVRLWMVQESDQTRANK